MVFLLNLPNLGVDLPFGVSFRALKLEAGTCLRSQLESELALQAPQSKKAGEAGLRRVIF
jgi:hypothetical protein